MRTIERMKEFGKGYWSLLGWYGVIMVALSFLNFIDYATAAADSVQETQALITLWGLSITFMLALLFCYLEAIVKRMNAMPLMTVTLASEKDEAQDKPADAPVQEER